MNNSNVNFSACVAQGQVTTGIKVISIYLMLPVSLIARFRSALSIALLSLIREKTQLVHSTDSVSLDRLEAIEAMFSYIGHLETIIPQIKVNGKTDSKELKIQRSEIWFFQNLAFEVIGNDLASDDVKATVKFIAKCIMDTIIPVWEDDPSFSETSNNVQRNAEEEAYNEN